LYAWEGKKKSSVWCEGLVICRSTSMTMPADRSSTCRSSGKPFKRSGSATVVETVVLVTWWLESTLNCVEGAL